MIPIIIGISGKTGAGKSTLSKALSLKLNGTLISWDDFDDVSSEPEDYIEWYHQGQDYRQFKRAALAAVLNEIKQGKSIIHPILNTELTPTKYVIYDAPLGRLHEETGKSIDLMIHIEVPLDILLCRRILRDFQSKETTKQSLLEEIQFYFQHSRPLYFDDTLKQTADLVINGILSTEEQIKRIKNILP